MKLCILTIFSLFLLSFCSSYADESIDNMAIVYPADSEWLQFHAAKEMAKYLQLQSGDTVPVYLDTAPELAGYNNLIVIGQGQITKQLEAASQIDLAPMRQEFDERYIIKTLSYAGKNYLLLAGNNGTLSLMGTGAPLSWDISGPGTDGPTTAGLWHLDENLDTITYDDDLANPGRDNDGFFGPGSAAPTWEAAGKFGSGIYFDGVDDYIQIDDSFSLDIQDEVTVECWVKVTATTGTWMRVVWKQDAYGITINPDGTFSGSFLISADGSLPGQYYNSPNSTTVVTDGAWHHLAVTFDGQTMKTYVGGILEGADSSNSGRIINSVNPLILGDQYWTPALPFKGYLDEVRISNVALAESYAGGITSDSVETFTYGVFEETVRVPSGTNAIWGLKGTGTTLAWKADGSDSLMIQRNGTDIALITDVDLTEFHDYKIDWNGGGTRFYIDDNLRAQISASDTQPVKIFHSAYSSPYYVERIKIDGVVYDDFESTIFNSYDTNDSPALWTQPDAMTAEVINGRGSLYAVYEYLEKYCGVGFFADAEYIPPRRQIPFDSIDDYIIPKYKIRFLNNPSGWGKYYRHLSMYFGKIDDWEKRLDWMAKNRLNLAIADRATFYGKPAAQMWAGANPEPCWGNDYRAELYKQLAGYGRSLGIKFHNYIHIETEYQNPAQADVVVQFRTLVDKEFGTDHTYFFGSMESSALAGIDRANGCYEIIRRIDPHAFVSTDTWDFYTLGATPQQMADYIQGTPADLYFWDTVGDFDPDLHKRANYFYGGDWGLGNLNDYYAWDMLQGDVDSYIDYAQDIANDPLAQKCNGGWMMAENSAVYYKAYYGYIMPKLFWDPNSINKSTCLDDFINLRYGNNTSIKQSYLKLIEWEKEYHFFYNVFHRMGIVNFSHFLVADGGARMESKMNDEDIAPLKEAYNLAVSAWSDLRVQETYTNYLTELGKTYLVSKLDQELSRLWTVYKAETSEFNQGRPPSEYSTYFRRKGGQIRNQMRLLEKYISTHPMYLAGNEYSRAAAVPGADIAEIKATFADSPYWLDGYYRVEIAELTRKLYEPEVDGFIDILKSRLDSQSGSIISFPDSQYDSLKQTVQNSFQANLLSFDNRYKGSLRNISLKLQRYSDAMLYDDFDCNLVDENIWSISPFSFGFYAGQALELQTTTAGRTMMSIDSFQYGRMEVRLKSNQSADFSIGWADSGINQIYFNVNGPQVTTHVTGEPAVYQLDVDESAYHSFEISWNPALITFRVDGTTLGTYENSLNAPHQLRIGLQQQQNIDLDRTVILPPQSLAKGHCIGSSSEYTATAGWGLKYIDDGDQFHGRGWASEGAAANQWLDFDFGDTITVYSLVYYTENDAAGSSQGRHVRDYQVLSSSNGTDWTVVRSGTLSKVTKRAYPLSTITLPAPLQTRFLRFKILSGYNASIVTSGGIEIWGEDTRPPSLYGNRWILK